MRRASPRTELVAVLFTDIVASTEIAREVGDRGWASLVGAHHRIVRAGLRRHGGRELDTAGDGFFAVFPRPAEAVRSAVEISNGVRGLGLEIRAGIHLGEAEVMGSKVGGAAVNTAARIMSLAGAGEVLVSRTVRDAIAGKGIGFEDRGVHPLKGLEGEYQVFAVTEVDGEARAAALDADEARDRRRAHAPEPAFPGGRPRPAIVVGSIAGLLVVAGAIALAASRSSGPGSAGGASTSPSGSAATPLGSVVEIDPVALSVERTVPGPNLNIPGGSFIPQVAVGEGGIWIYDANGLPRIDPVTGAIETPPPPHSIGFGTTPEVAVGLGDLVMTDGGNLQTVSVGAISKVDPATGRRHTVTFPGTTEPTGLEIGGRWIWESFTGGTLIRIDPRTLRGTRFELGSSIDVLAVSDEAVWVGNSVASTVQRVDPVTGTVSDPIQLTGSVDALTAEGERVWVIDGGSGTVTAVDESRTGQPVRIGEDPTDIVTAFGAIWITDGGGKLWRVDPLTGETSTIEVGSPLASVAVDRHDGTLWVLVSTH